MNGIRGEKTSQDLLWPQWGKPKRQAWTVWRRLLHIVLTDGSSLLLKNPLKAWINFSHQHWKWFLSEDKTKLYQHSHDGWLCHRKLRNITRAQRFHLYGHPIPMPTSTHMLPTTITKHERYILADNTCPMIVIPSTTTPLIEKLDPTKTPWLFVGVNKSSNMHHLIQDLMQGTLVAASDGSFCIDTSVTTAGWTLESRCGSQHISGIATPAFTTKCNGAYRGELAGLLSIVHMATYLCLSHNIPHTTITIYCDNVRALDIAFNKQSYTRNPSHKHSDIVSGIAGVLKLGIVSISFQHVYAHQDSTVPYEDLPREAQMNVRMDALAKTANRLVKQGSLHPPRVSNHPLGFLPVSVDNRWIHHQAKDMIYSFLSEKITHQWWLTKGRYTLQDIPSIHWDTCSSAAESQTRRRRQFMSKWASGCMGTGKNMRLWNLRAGDGCPFCLEPAEDTTHILRCQHQDAIAIWNAELDLLTNKLIHLGTSMELVAALVNDLKSWRYRQPFSDLIHIDVNLQPAIVAMRQITYDKVLEGLIPKTVIDYQDAIYRREENNRHSGKSWAKKVFNLFWNLIHKVWTARNEQLHNTARIFDLQGLQEVKTAISMEYALGLHRLPACEFSMMFSSPLDVLLKRSLQNLRHWLLTIRLGRELHGGSNLIIDQFSQNGPLRKWLGLPTITG